MTCRKAEEQQITKGWLSLGGEGLGCRAYKIPYVSMALWNLQASDPDFISKPAEAQTPKLLRPSHSARLHPTPPPTRLSVGTVPRDEAVIILEAPAMPQKVQTSPRLLLRDASGD